MLTLICGIPGHGKTLYAVDKIAEGAAKDGRQVYFAGIPDCTVPGWKAIPGANDFDAGTCNYTPESLAAARGWFRLPARSVVVIDEAHQVFPQRGPSMPVPEWAGMAAVLRRLGLDLVLITQDGNSIDHFMRRRAGRYFHIWRAMGLARATVWEFPKWCDWEDYHTRDIAVKHQWAYRKSAYLLYKSAEVHTVKRRVPLKVLWFPLGALAIFGALFLGYRSLTSGTALSAKKAADKAAVGVAALPSLSKLGPGSGSGVAKLSPSAWLAERQPRFPDFPESAPWFDGLARPVAFPTVAGCLASKARCTCYSQQGTRLSGVSAGMCRDYVRDGAFNPYLVAKAARIDGPGLSGRAKPQGSSSAAYVSPQGETRRPLLFPAERPVVLGPVTGAKASAASPPRPLDLIEGHK